jgi:hypothetical protein
MGIRFDIASELPHLCFRNKDGSFATQADCAHILHQAAKTLQKAGFQTLAATSLKHSSIRAFCCFPSEKNVNLKNCYQVF